MRIPLPDTVYLLLSLKPPIVVLALMVRRCIYRQISVKNRQYASVQEWIEAEIADQRKDRKRLERAAHLRLKKLKSRSLLQRYVLCFLLWLRGWWRRWYCLAFETFPARYKLPATSPP